jgi:spore coat protein A
MATLAILTFSFGSATAAAGLQVTSDTGMPSDPLCGQQASSPVPAFFTDEATQLPVATPDSANHYTLSAHMGKHSFATGWPAVDSLGYNTVSSKGKVIQQLNYLGPMIVTKKGTPVNVKIVNNLPPAGTTMFPRFGYGMSTEMALGNNVVFHRHGGLQAAVDDGSPLQTIAPGTSRTNFYPNNQAAAPLWYHDHTDMVTSFNVYAGLAGVIPNTDSLEPSFKLPAGDFARSYLLQDKSFNADKTLCYTHASPEFFGDLPVINGTIAPRQTVQPRRYTFTLVNGSDSRFYHLSLKAAAPTTTSQAPQMTVVGSDSGYVLNPAKVSDLLIAPGERYTVVVDFTGHPGKWVLSNDADTPFPSGDPTVATIPSLMRFDVGTTASSVDRSSIPSTIKETNNQVSAVQSLATARLRTIQAAEKSPGVPQLGNAQGVSTFTDPVTETPFLGSTEAWAMRNHSPDTHPIHEHLVELRLVGRWPVTEWSEQDPISGNAVPLAVGAFEAPGAWESGPKDTFVSPPDYITVWVGAYTIAGTSVWHCHILSHEDGMDPMVGMMRPLEIQNTKRQTQLPVIGGLSRLDQLIRIQSAS